MKKAVLSILALGIMIFVGLADLSFDDCGCTSVGLGVSNNGCVAPCEVEMNFRTYCVTTTFLLPPGVTDLATDSSIIFVFDTVASFNVDLETNDHASGISCDVQNMQIFSE
jgi:hypothetical protein